MKRFSSIRWLTLAALLLCLRAVEGSTNPPVANPPAPPAAAVDFLRFDWRDASRDRDVPAKIYFPRSGTNPCPVIVFSHGLGGSREGYEYLGRHWASHGYVSAHLQHAGSDDAVWKDVPAGERLAAMRRAANLRNSLSRTRDVAFALDQLARLEQAAGPLQHRLDLTRVGVAGHSFGAATTLAVAGASSAGLLGGRASGADPRIKAAIPMSAPVSVPRAQLDQTYAAIRIPCLHLTGTRDESVIGNTTAADRRLPFDHIRGADQYLITFTGGDHMIFSGRPRLAPGGGQDAAFQEQILRATTAFWDAYLRGDATAKRWLADGGCATALGALGKLEQKLAPPATAR